MEQDRRSAPRVEVPGGLPGEVSVLAPVEIREFSRTGAKLDTAFPLILNSLHDIRLQLGEQSVVVKGRIVHCRIAELAGELVRYRAGIEFIDMPEHVASAIASYLEQIAAQHAADAGTQPPDKPISP